MALSKEKKQEVMKQFRRGERDSGSPEVQIAMLTARINVLTEHFKIHKKDHHSRRGLLRMVEDRKKLLRYLEQESPDKYKKLIQDLDIRK